MDEEKRYVVRFFWRQNASKKDILESMQKSYGNDCPSEGFVRKWLGRFNNGDLSIEDRPRVGRPVCQENVIAVSSLIEEQPSASARAIAMILNIDKNTVINILRNTLHLEKRYSKWIPHVLSELQKQNRVDVSTILLKQLTSLSEIQLASTLTCDESWFYLTYYDDGIWTDPSTKLVKPKRLISDPKIMIFTAFSIVGIVMVKSIPPKTSFNSTTMCSIILPQLKESAQNTHGIRNNVRLRIHLDNARPHTAKNTKVKIAELGFIQLPQPSFSPDISPNDFFLYGILKDKLKGKHHTTFDDLLKSIDEILAEIPKTTWKAVFDEWINRLHEVISRGGEYI